MKILLLLAAPVCLAPPRGPLPVRPADPVPTAVPTAPWPADTYEDLLQGYRDQLQHHGDLLEAAGSLKEREKLDKKHPVQEYWRKFSKLAKSDGRALVWMVEHASQKESDPKKAARLEDEGYATLFEDHLGAEWFGLVLSLVKDEDRFSEAERLARYELVLESNEHPEVQCEALYRKGWSLRRSDEQGSDARAEETFRACAERFPGTRYGTSALAEVVTKEQVAEGATAPDFFAESLDGHAFKLSDYRGKVVLLDFYGFW